MTKLAGGQVTLSKDGDQWCALYGEDLQVGVAGFGETKVDAIAGLFHQLGLHGLVRWQVCRQPEVEMAHGEWLTLARAINEHGWRREDS